MQIKNNKTCVLCGKKLESVAKGLTSMIWYSNCPNEGDWGKAIVHKKCLLRSIVKPMIDDGDV